MSSPKTVLVTGGAGYKGCVLVPRLLAAGYRVVVYDLMLFGSHGLPSHPQLKVVAADIRDTEAFSATVRGCDAVIHMACISNDPSFELDPNLSRTINFDCFEPLVAASRAAGVGRFIYVSSSSVYGVSDAPEVTEDHPLIPLTAYNRYKGLCEPILLRYQSQNFVPVILRPATVFGCSPRMRFDLTINILTNHAVHRGVITVFGGTQKRPNIHIEDVTDLYVRMLSYPDSLIAGETFNVGCENFTVTQLAQKVADAVEREPPHRRPIRIETTVSDDNRSYHINSKKIADKLGYTPQRSIEDGIGDICQAIRDGRFADSMSNDAYVNVKTVRRLNLS